MEVQPKRYITPKEYLEIERAAQFKSEYHVGEMFAVAGASEEHNSISVNITATLAAQVRRSGCKFFSADMRVHVPATDFFAYPDGVIACEPRFFDSPKDTLLNPALIIEILSPSTEAYDRGTKSSFYRKLPSLRFYLLVAQETQRVEILAKNEQGSWVLTEFAGSASIVKIESLNFSLRIPLQEIYEGVF
jgi:Uma2 family endonuclease